jgi:hypothetical protein
MYHLQFHRVLILATAVAFVCVAGPAQASIQLDIGIPNSGIAAYPGPYGTLTANLSDSNTATITLTGLSNGSYYYLFGDGSTLGLNLTNNGTITVTNTPTNYKETSSGQIDGFGNFNFAMDFNDGFGKAVNSLSFTLNGTLGNWTSDDAFLTPNSDGYLAAYSNENEAAATGYAANGTLIPEPTTLLIWSLLSGLGITVGWWGWRKAV